MTKVLVSACLLGHPCRWHGRAVPMSKYVLRYRQEHPGVEFVPVCPEQLGGLPTPRPAVKWVKGRIFETCPADVWRRLARIPVPVLFLRGERSATFLRSAARRGARRIADAKLVEVPGSSHFLPFERPEEAVREIVRFAAEVSR